MAIDTASPVQAGSQDAANTVAATLHAQDVGALVLYADCLYADWGIGPSEGMRLVRGLLIGPGIPIDEIFGKRGRPSGPVAMGAAEATDRVIPNGLSESIVTYSDRWSGGQTRSPQGCDGLSPTNAKEIRWPLARRAHRERR